MTEGAEIARMLEAIGRDVLSELRGLSEHDLNRSLPLPEMNTLFALATHLVGSAEMWVLQMACGRPLARDRDAEFRAAGAYADLAARYERWIAAIHDALDHLSAAALDAPAHTEPGHIPFGAVEPVTARACLLHAIEHSALHWGHIQLTRQMLSSSVESFGGE